MTATKFLILLRTQNGGKIGGEGGGQSRRVEVAVIRRRECIISAGLDVIESCSSVAVHRVNDFRFRQQLHLMFENTF